jgi:hypothetical protein
MAHAVVRAGAEVEEGRMALSNSGNIILMHQCCACSQAWADDAPAALSVVP